MAERVRRVDVSLELGEFDKAIQIARALGNQADLRLLILLGSGPLTCREAHAAGPYRARNYTESTYKALERMRRLGILVRNYDEDRRRWIYSVRPDGPVRVVLGTG